MIRRHELASVRKIDAINARVPVRRATDAHVHFFCAGFFERLHARLAGRAAHDGIVHYDDALALHQLADEVELHAHVEVADEL